MEYRGDNEMYKLERGRNLYYYCFKWQWLFKQLQPNLKCKSSSRLPDLRKWFDLRRVFHTMVCTCGTFRLFVEHRGNYTVRYSKCSRNLYGYHH